MGVLSRPRFDRRIAGVCAAFARAYGWDLNIVRIATLLIAIFTGFGFIAYIVCWIVLPEDPVALPPYAPYPPPPYPPDPRYGSGPGNYPPAGPPTA